MMKIIEALSKDIEEEISDAGKYIKCALKIKEEYPKIADLMYKLSLQEMEHMTMLHEAVTGLITNYRSEKGEPPEGMKALYNYLHEQQIKNATEVKVMQGMYHA